MLRKIPISIRIIGIVLILFFAIIALVGMVWTISHEVKGVGVSRAEQVMYAGQRDKIKLGTQTMAVALGKALAGISDRQRQHDIIKSYIQDYRFEEDKSGYYYTYVGTKIFMHPTRRFARRAGHVCGAAGQN